jgi:phosphoenolpyruvate carboxykinase (GTP)
VLAWIFQRCNDEAEAADTAIGRVPAPHALDTGGLDLSDDQMTELLSVDHEEWRVQLPQVKQHFATFGDSLPDELRAQLELLEERLGEAAG